MIVEITPSTLSGEINAISSKSHAHRIISLALMADKPTNIKINTISKDIMRTLHAVVDLGGEVSFYPSYVTIFPPSSKALSPVINCGESGTTARFMLPIAAVMSTGAKLIGEGRLPGRPFSQLVREMRRNGAVIDNEALPITVSGTLRPGEFFIEGNISSQYISGLLLSLGKLKDVSKIHLTTPLESSPYVNMTIDALKDFSVLVKRENNTFTVIPKDYISPGELSIEGDWSNSAFFIAANHLGSKITINGLNNFSHQGDRKITELLDECEIDVSEIPDLVPILAVLGAAKCGKTIIKNGARLRMKESDRIESVCKCINDLGGEAKERKDGIEITGHGGLTGGCVSSFNDHRIVMAAAIAATICKNRVTINGADAVLKSYPNFFSDYKSLGGKINVL